MLKAAEKAFCWCIVPTVTFSTHTLNREFEVTEPNKVWATDITYVWTLEGWLYVAVVIDLFSRQVVGGAVDDHMRTSLCIRALQMAFYLVLSEYVCRYKKLYINNADDCFFFGSKVFVI
jgi:hypothetical protein